MVCSKILISAVVLTKNEERNIKDCLDSLNWCDEIIIIDDYSQDETLAKCKIQNIKCKVYQRHLEEDFAGQRNFGLEKARGDWVLFIDADERVSPLLKNEIQEKILKQPKFQKYEAFYLKRNDFFFGKWLKFGETGKIKLLRLAKKTAGKWVRPVHETWQVKGKIGELKNPLLHYSHQTIQEFLEKINFYTDLNAQFLYKNGIRTSWWEIICYPLAKFIKNYFLKLGFMDGEIGFLHAIFMSFHSFLTRAKLWFLWSKDV